ncbi:hypothetical protein L211DRAFT_37727 [Terfezia boudieri ATCC MYA-4762]|uniref:Uncharacterized protein n=1 Tax=Terfezia boudieri ATCC MYA-4762 TaxID=1051890 RepID=A0A3N4MCQ7_9PEZI|nr:hypothetical protein L211DRAFT_37727 [Terfezia boudieri ATCC MYA-4762]
MCLYRASQPTLCLCQWVEVRYVRIRIYVESSPMYVMYSTKTWAHGAGARVSMPQDGYHRVSILLQPEIRKLIRCPPASDQRELASFCGALFSAVVVLSYSACWHSSPQICSHILKTTVTYWLLPTNKYTHSFVLTADRNKGLLLAPFAAGTVVRRLKDSSKGGGLRVRSWQDRHTLRA